MQRSKASSFEDYVSSLQKGFGYLQIEHPCSFKIDYEFKFCGLLNWQVGRFAAL